MKPNENVFKNINSRCELNTVPEDSKAHDDPSYKSHAIEH
jgi:hypothetical protein